MYLRRSSTGVLPTQLLKKHENVWISRYRLDIHELLPTYFSVFVLVQDLTRLPPDGGGELGAAKLLQIVILLRNGRRVNPRRDLWSPAMTIPRGHTKSKRQDRDAIGSLLDKGAGEIWHCQSIIKERKLAHGLRPTRGDKSYL